MVVSFCVHVAFWHSVAFCWTAYIWTILSTSFLLAWRVPAHSQHAPSPRLLLAHACDDTQSYRQSLYFSDDVRKTCEDSQRPRHRKSSSPFLPLSLFPTSSPRIFPILSW
jgi:hypothetical protein